MQLQGAMAGRPVIQMAPNAVSPTSNLGAPNNGMVGGGGSSGGGAGGIGGGPPFPASSNLGGGGPNAAQYRFGANALNGVPITVLGRSGSPAGKPERKEKKRRKKQGRY